MSPSQHPNQTLTGAASEAGHVIDKVPKPPHAVNSPHRHCSAPRGWLWAQCSHGTHVHVPLKCGKCEACLERRRAQHTARMAYAIAEFPPTRLLTLTSHPGTDWPQIMKGFASLVRRIRKTAPDTQYAAIKERAPRNQIKHLHVVLVNSAYIPQADLSKWWQHYNGAKIVDIRKIYSTAAVGYISKHLTKQSQQFRNPVTYSRHFPKQPFESTFEIIMKVDHIPDATILTGVSGWGTLVGPLAPDCDCFTDLVDLTDGERIWLASHCPRSPPL